MSATISARGRHNPEAWWRLVIGVLAVGSLASCSGKAIVAEGRAAGGRSSAPTIARDAGAGGSAGSGGSPENGGTTASAGGESSDSGATTGQFTAALLVNDPCDVTGFVEFYASGVDPNVVKATGYVVAFDPPRILLATELARTAFGDFSARVDHVDLIGSPDCVALRSDAVFVVETLKDGTFNLPPRPGFNLESPFSDWCWTRAVSFDPRVEPIDVVRGFRFHPGETELDGPFPMSRAVPPDLRSGFVLDGPDAGALSCNEPGYVGVVAAHKGELLVGLLLTSAGNP